MSYKVTLIEWPQADEYEKELMDEYGMLLKIDLDGDIEYHSDCMEPEDVKFYRDLSWVPESLERAYAAGVADGLEEAAHADRVKRTP